MELTTKHTLGLWSSAWKRPRFRLATVLSAFALLVNLIALPSFFQFVEQRPGVTLDDPVLRVLPPRDFSQIIFFLIYLSLFYVIARSVFSPAVFVRFISSYALVILIRVATLSVVPLDPPVGLIPMPDPLTPIFSGSQALTRDLFFSGHTSTAFLVYLSLTGKAEKMAALAIVAVLALLLLFQHIHYTIDVIAAIPFAYLCYGISKKIAP